MGLLDFEQLASNPLLNIGLGILANNQGNYGALGPALGRGAQQGLLTTQQALHAQQLKKLADMQMQMQQFKMEQERKQQEREDATQNALRSAWTPGGMQPNPNFSFMEGNNAVMSGQEYNQPLEVNKPAGFDLNKAMPELMAADPRTAIGLYQQLQKREAPIKASAGDVFLDPETWQPKYTVPDQPKIGNISPDKFTPESIAAFSQTRDYRTLVPIQSAEELNPNKPFMVVDGKIVPNKAYQAYELSKAKAGATNTNVSVGFPKETFKNERDLRNDFQGLPTTKAFREVQAAYDQISTALKRPSAANDLAAATKFMKILDPSSVVRESELAMAMEATGKLDQLQNYANRIMTGEKLTPSQRADFGAAAEALYRAAAERHNQSAQEYQSMARDYELNPDRIAKPVQLPPTKKPAPFDKSTLPKVGPKGQIIRNPETGQRLQSDGFRWKEIK